MSNHVNKSMSTYIHLSKYSRWKEGEGRRETWDETVGRLVEFWEGKYPDIFPSREILEAVRSYSIMPSMRSLMTAGPALDRDHAAGYNCAAIAVDNPRVFDEIFYLLMCGSGVGFSVEREFTSKLPMVSERMDPTDTVLKIRDSKIGWAKGLKELIALLYNGDVPKWDLSLVRPAGARLKTFGGRASGPDPLDKLFRYTVKLFSKATGRRLNSFECHDLCCKIAETVIVGSVRRSAMISFQNLTDDRCRRAKTGEWYLQNPERMLSNNSVMYTEKPDLISFMKEMVNLYQSKAGERGIVNQEALRKKAVSCGRDAEVHYLLNPCGEAILRSSGGLCNLTEVVVRPEDTLPELEHKVRLATILGTFQSTLTNFRYLRKIWKDNAEEERLLGVSLTGIMDHHVLSDPDTAGPWLRSMKVVAQETNRDWALALGIPKSKQLTLIKPSGTVSQLCGTASGIHPRFAPYYLRRVTQDNKDPLTQLMIDQGVPHKRGTEKTTFSFPMSPPSSSISARNMGAIEQLKLWKVYQQDWCDGNPSQTIYYTDSTFLEVQQWVYKEWDNVGGLSFFPYDDFVYDRELQPYLEITKEEYEEALRNFPPEINWGGLGKYEQDDHTTGSQELACAGGKCEL